MNSQQGLEHKTELEESGLIQGHDFTWTYVPPGSATWYPDVSAGSNNNGRTVIFWFRDPALATFYRLKWS